MPDYPNTSLPSANRVVDSSQVAYQPNTLGHKAVPQSRAHAIVFTVVMNKNDSLVLNEQSSKKNIEISKESIKGLTTQNLSKGDKLILLSSNSQKSSFEIVKNGLSNQGENSLKHFKPALAEKLNITWPDISTDILRKVQPNVLGAAVLNANSNTGIEFTKALIKLANINNQPLLDIKLQAKVESISALKINLVANLANTMGGNVNVSLALPVLPELSEKLSKGQIISLELNATNINKTFSKITTLQIATQKGTQISKQSLAELNKAVINNTSFKQTVENMLANVLFSHKNSKNSDVLFTPNNANLNLLPNTIKQALVTPAIEGKNEYKNGQVIINSQATSNGDKVSILLVNKPQVISVPTLTLITAGENNKLETLLKILSTNNHAGTQTSEDVNISPQAITRTSSTIQQPVVTTQNSLQQKLIAHLLNQNKSNGVISKIHDLSNTLNIESNEKVSTSTHNKLMQLTSLLNSDINISLSKTEKLSQSIPNLSKQLLSLIQNAPLELKAFLQQSLPQFVTQKFGNENSLTTSNFESLLNSESIKALLTEESIPSLQTLNINQTTHNQNYVQTNSIINGLVKVLTASLFAKMNLPTNQLLSALHQFNTQTVGSTKQVNLARNLSNQTKAVQDLSRFDPNSNLLKEISKILGNHSLHKLAATENTLQGQDSFYYALPNMFSSELNDIEILVRKEKKNNTEEENTPMQTQWRLSMKLDVGTKGEVLAKVKLIENQLKLDLYTSNETLKKQVISFLPMLEKRLVQSGLDIKSACYLGKIPKTLYKTDFQVVHAYA